ncbi:MAG: Bug family tripartite tricarboxylate transporter substrate binding protein [Gammaproteobacteria bacterium]
MASQIRFILSAAALGLSLGSTPLAAQTPYPHDVVTLVTHSSPGGGSDVFLRELARYLGPELGVDIVVENVRGGSGARAMAQLATAPADGSRFYAATPTYIYTSLLSNSSYNYNDLDPLVNVFFAQEVVYTRADGPFSTLTEVINHARSDRGRWGAANPASLERQALEQLKRVAAVDAAIVSHEGGGDLMINVLNGTLDIGVGEAQEIRSQIDAGRLRVLAVFGAERMTELPDVPTVRETGFDIVLRKFRGLAGPRGLPDDISDAVSAAVQRALDDPGYQNAYRDAMLIPAFMPRDEYRLFVADFGTETEAFLRESGVLQ